MMPGDIIKPDPVPSNNTLIIMAQARALYENIKWYVDSIKGTSDIISSYSWERAVKDAEVDYARIQKIIEDNRNEEENN